MELEELEVPVAAVGRGENGGAAEADPKVTVVGVDDEVVVGVVGGVVPTLGDDGVEPINDLIEEVWVVEEEDAGPGVGVDEAVVVAQEEPAEGGVVGLVEEDGPTLEEAGDEFLFQGAKWGGLTGDEGPPAQAGGGGLGDELEDEVFKGSEGGCGLLAIEEDQAFFAGGLKEGVVIGGV